MAKMSIIYDGFKDLAYQIDKAGGNLNAAVEDALHQTQEFIQTGVIMAAAPYSQKGGGKGYATGTMFRSIIKDEKIYWNGPVAEVNVGFDLEQTFASIFIMYGTPRHAPNHPGTAKDKKIYDAIRGKRTQLQIAELQESVLRKYLSLGD